MPEGKYVSHYIYSDSGADHTYHTRDTAGRAYTGIRIEILKNAMFGPTQFSVYICFARSIKEMPFGGLRWITGRKNGLNRLVRSNIYRRSIVRSR